MKKKIFIFVLMLILFPWIRVNAESTSGIEHKNRFVTTRNDDYYYHETKNYKTKDGYLLLNGSKFQLYSTDGTLKWNYNFVEHLDTNYVLYDYVIHDDSLAILSCYQRSYIEFPGPIIYEEEVRTEAENHFRGISSNDFTCNIQVISLATGHETKKVENVIGNYIDVLGDNYLIDTFEGYELRDKNFNVIKTINNEHYTFVVSNDILYSFYATSEGYYYKAYDKNLKLIELKELDLEDCMVEEAFRTTRAVMVEDSDLSLKLIYRKIVKTGDNFYYQVNGQVCKIGTNGKGELKDYRYSYNNYEYTDYVSTGDYFVIGRNTVCHQAAKDITKGVKEGVLGAENSNSLGMSSSSCYATPYIDVYDADFNFVETLAYPEPTITYVDELDYNDGSLLSRTYSENNDSNEYSTIIIVDEWSVKFNIETTTDGNGMVEVVDKASAGDEIVFKVSAKKGYVLKSIKVIGLISGNTIEIEAKDLEEIENEDTNSTYYSVSRNEFIMPDEDVRIEASFGVDTNNPDTGISLMLPMLLFVSAGMILLISIKTRNKKYM